MMIASFPWRQCASSRANANIRLEIMFVNSKIMIIVYYFMLIKTYSKSADLVGMQRRIAHNHFGVLGDNTGWVGLTSIPWVLDRKEWE